jgi:hypothetical protein
MQFTESQLRRIIREEVLSTHSKRLNESIIELFLLAEGIYDPGILKAVFMAGGPGSGKSYTAGAVFGGNAIEGATQQAGTALGLRIINSDPAFEKYLADVGVSPSDLADMSDEDFKAMTEPADSPRGKASKMKKVQQAATEIGRLGMIIDGTGDDATKIARKKEAVEAIGYDTMMIFVNTTLEMAQERNLKRDRKLPADLVEEIWTNVQANRETYESMFSNFQVIDNTEYEWSTAEQEAAAVAVGFVQSPVQNPIGLQWAQDALTAKGADPNDPWVQKQMRKITG